MSTKSTAPAPKHAPMSQVKSLIRRKLRKVEEHEHTSLNIYPMMDMMTILLVFMVMQFASSSAAIVTESDEMQLPYSVSTEALQDAVPLQITRDAIIIDERRLVSLDNGRIAARDKQGGATSMMIPTIHRAMCQIRDIKKAIEERDPNQHFGGEVQIIADRRTPYRTVAEVLYTIGQCEFHELRFIVGRPQATADRR